MPIFVVERANTGEGTGHTVWDGAVVLAKYLEKAYPRGLVGKRVLELGAGTGLVGVVSSVLGASTVYLTDLEYSLRTCRETIDRNKAVLKGHVECRELDWCVTQTRRVQFALLWC